MSKDLTALMQEWQYDPDQTMRIIVADDGRSVLQVRLPLGIEQYELAGRPDGSRPFGKETVVEELADRVEQHRVATGSTDGFHLSHEDCVLLQNEGILYYYRYLLLFQMNDFERVAHDTEHNLRVCELLEKFCSDPEDRNAVLQYKPYILRMNAMAKAMFSIHNHLKDAARGILEHAIEEIEGMNEIESPAFQFERIRSVNYLKSALKQIDEKAPKNPLTVLQKELEVAVQEEDYERAARLRDQIRELS